MATTKIKVGRRQFAFSAPAKMADEGQRDTTGPKPSTERAVKVGSTSYKYYPWGDNNLLPNERVKLLRSNGDAQNLVQARIDFLFGGGFGFFKHVQKDGQTIREPFTNQAIEEYQSAYGLPDLGEVVDRINTGLVETGNAFVRRSVVDKLPIYSLKDSLICRATLADPVVKHYLLCPDWSDQESVEKNCQILPVFNPANADVLETMVHLRPYQSGQPYYGFAQYWGEQSVHWIEVMNYIAKSMIGTVKHNKNLAHVCRIASRYFDEMAAAEIDTESPEEPEDFEKQKNKVRDKFYENVEAMFSEKNDTGPRIIYDECDLTPDGKLAGFIQFEEIKRSLNAKELSEAYQIALLGFANASRILPGLSGVSDGNALGGSGSELKVSANFQQHFRTARERKLVCSLFNSDVKKALKLPKDVFAGFQDILLVSDDKNPAGKENKTTSAGNGSDPKKPDNAA
ncbi:hypothetical protein [Persicitalea jodogahamensis]|uniref:Uncharacterized protein n=1 Tax=Persicitalea jodogahamensis TaxID=402147 RepID=A0A8J3G9K4_9BACT|nr:hypothetical protein [Persicitalea jodogahamensis]GHB64182.1 hypothetical protein GCM10007390_17580 [Persicitalea jodogahamensis]